MVQTFLPFPDLAASACALDQKRLGKQRVETLQIMRALTVPGHGWRHHPAARMWQGHRPALMAYQRAVCAEWAARGFADTTLESTRVTLAEPAPLDADALDLAAWEQGSCPMPVWFGDEAVHRSHRSRLLQKDPEHYRPLFPDTPEDLDYVWPVPKATSPD